MPFLRFMHFIFSSPYCNVVSRHCSCTGSYFFAIGRVPFVVVWPFDFCFLTTGSIYKRSSLARGLGDGFRLCTHSRVVLVMPQCLFRLHHCLRFFCSTSSFTRMPRILPLPHETALRFSCKMRTWKRLFLRNSKKLSKYALVYRYTVLHRRETSY